MDAKTNEQINKRLQEQLRIKLSRYDKDWFAIAAYGSMNYDLFDKNSDVDSKFISLPSLREIAIDKEADSYITLMLNDEQIDVKDIRKTVELFRKQNPSFLEILFTDFWIANPKYQDLWIGLRQRAEDIVRYSPYRFIKACKGMVYEKASKLSHPYPSRLELINEYGYDSKQLMNAMRICDLAQNYVEGASYKESLTTFSETRDYMLAVKNYNLNIDIDLALRLMANCKEKIDEIDAKFNAGGSRNNVNEEIDDYLDELVYDIIVRSIKGEINGKI